MSKATRSDRKGSDEAIIKLNAVGLSTATIARIQGMHPTSITNRLKSLGIPACDTRRSFMEDVIKTLTPAQRNWLAEQVGPRHTINQFITSLIIEAYIKKTEK